MALPDDCQDDLWEMAHRQLPRGKTLDLGGFPPAPAEFPILLKLIVVELGPRQHEPQLAVGQRPCRYAAPQDIDAGPVPRMLRKKVWWVLFLPVHRDPYPAEVRE